MGREPLKLSFDPLTIEHLGGKMYSRLPNALAELVANAYDADSTQVKINIQNDGSTQSIIVSDDGHGMTYDELRNNYLRIGRNRRVQDGRHSKSGNRIVSGKKGLGKLALFGIGEQIAISSSTKGSGERVEVVMEWADIENSAGGEYLPNVEFSEDDPDRQGTEIKVSGLRRVTSIDHRELAQSLSILVGYVDADFQVLVFRDGENAIQITPEMRYQSIEIEHEWNVPDDFLAPLGSDLSALSLSGKVVAARSPLRNEMRGVAIYASGRLANEPEFFGASESSFAYSYITGYIHADYLDDLVPDVIATDRRTINWDTPVTSTLRDLLRSAMFRVEEERREIRRKNRIKEIEEASGKNTQQWVESLRGPEKQSLSSLLEVISSPDVQLTTSTQNTLVRNIEELVPPYADMHWRHLHIAVQEASEGYYKEQSYYEAVEEAIKRYVTEVRIRSGVAVSFAVEIINQAFSEQNPKLRVFAKYDSDTIFNFATSTGASIERGQRAMSDGLISGFRNPLAHEEKAKLHSSGAFNHQDCLDALSILSHLFRRLDDAQHTANIPTQ